MAKRTRSYPFLFVGQGFGTSRKCLEGYLWFETAPKAKDQVAIVDLLPLPVLLGLRFVGDLAHFGSDDRLESFVIAAYDPKYKKLGFEAAVEKLEEKWDRGEDIEPTKKVWKAFCDHFERAMLAIHARCKLVLALKPDDGEYGKELGPWHDWSVTNAVTIAERALARRGKTTRDLSFLAVNLVSDVLDELGEIPRDQRETWLRWVDRLIVEGDRDVQQQFLYRGGDLIRSFPADARRDEMMAKLRPITRRKIAKLLAPA